MAFLSIFTLFFILSKSTFIFPCGSEKEESSGDANGVEAIARNMKAIERAKLGFMCKQIIDMGRLMWVREHGLETQLVKYVPSSVSPENHLLVARHVSDF